MRWWLRRCSPPPKYPTRCMRKANRLLCNGHFSQEYKGSGSGKEKEMGAFKGSNKLSPKELERYKKENRCFKCRETWHSYCACPIRATKKDTPQVTICLLSCTHEPRRGFSTILCMGETVLRTWEWLLMQVELLKGNKLH